MGDKYYRLIEEEGKHLADSHQVDGAYSGVYLDDETNKPSGAGVFEEVDIDDLLNDEQSNSDNSDGAALVGALIGGAVVAAVVGAKKAYPHIKKWVTKTAVPKVKGLFGKNKETTIPVEDTLKTEEDISTELDVNVAFDKYKENISSEEAQKELLEAFILYVTSIKKAQRVANANIVDTSGKIEDGAAFIETLKNNNVFESIKVIIQTNPTLLQNEQREILSEILGDSFFDEKQYITINSSNTDKLL